MSGGLVMEGLDIVQRYILALLGSQGAQEVPAKLWLQKELFLLSKLRENLANRAEFVPYLKGPYSEVVDGALSDLQNLGLVDFDPYGNDIRLTPKGRAAAATLNPKIPKELRAEIEEIKEFLNSLSEDELLVFTYYTYPDTVTDSVVRERVARVRIPRVLSMYRKGKVSLEKASELAGLSLPEFKKRAGGAADP